jgi:hypothetical protein
MGYNSTATTLNLTAKLTPLGRQKMISTNNNLIRAFSLGDSDANYYTNLTLSTGEVPSTSGDIGANNTISNSTAKSNGLKSVLIVNASGLLTKPVVSQSINILTDTLSNTFTTVSGTSLSYSIIDRGNVDSDSLVNLFYSFGLPLTNASVNSFTATTSANNGYSDTAFSGFASSKILVISLNDSTYGECLDGKTLKLTLPTSAGTYTIYSTYQTNSQSTIILDNQINDSYNPFSTQFGLNVSMLVSDNILTPNGGNGSLSWATGYNLNRPFSQGAKSTYNYKTNSNLSLTADTLVGISYLDKGFIVITNPTIVNNYTASAATATTLSFNSVSTDVYQVISCVADRGEFGTTTNPTFETGDIPRISEIGLYDDIGNLIAIAKTDRQINKNINEFLAFSVKISV